MAGIKTTIWDMNSHTKAKHEILEGYLKAWFPILSKWDNRIIYLDGFAGPGIYSKGEDGSPIIAINTALNHKLQERLSEIVFLFIESREDRANSLRAVINAMSSTLPNKFKVSVISAEFAPTLDNMLTNLEEQDRGLAPTFAFIDPFGFSGLPMKLIARLLANDKTEVLITFMGGFVTRFTDDLRANILDELFGTDQWRKADNIRDPDQRAKFFVDLYSSQLKKVGKVEYTLTFAMRDSSNRHLYHLVFGTKSIKGLEVMKEAMFSVDKRGTYKFSDFTDAGQTHLINYLDKNIWLADAAERVFSAFRGKTVNEKEVKKFVLVNTPYIYRKSILKYLESGMQTRIKNVQNRAKKGSFPDGCIISFDS